MKLVALIMLALMLTGCGTRPAFKFAVAGIGADMAATEYALAQPGLGEGNALVANRGVRLGLNSLAVWGLYEWQKRDYPDWPLWFVGALRFAVAGWNMHLAMEAR